MTYWSEFWESATLKKLPGKNASLWHMLVSAPYSLPGVLKQIWPQPISLLVLDGAPLLLCATRDHLPPPSLQNITCTLRESDGTRSRVPRGQSPSLSLSVSLGPIGPLTAASATQTCIYPRRDMRSGGGGEKTTTNARGRGCLGRWEGTHDKIQSQ